MAYETQEHVITLVAGEGSKLCPILCEEISQQVNATHTTWLAPDEALDIFYTFSLSTDAYGLLKRKLANLPIDFFIQPVASRRKKLLLTDMESTIIEQEMLDELADLIGLGPKVAEITRRAMNGELDFASALRERVALLRPQPVSILQEVAKRITYTTGAATLLATMKAHGAQAWLVSGGFTCFAQIVAQELGFNSFFANHLIVYNNVIAGEVTHPIQDKMAKKALVDKAKIDLGITGPEIISTGDGANDIPMLNACNEGGGLGIAFHAKPKVRDEVLPQINYGDLTALLYAQGYSKESFVLPYNLQLLERHS